MKNVLSMVNLDKEYGYDCRQEKHVTTDRRNVAIGLIRNLSAE
jgi:hypothetical protein